MTAPDTTHRDQLAATLGNSRLFWGTHADRWNDADWQQRFWEEAADAVIAAGWAPTTAAMTEDEARDRAMRGPRWDDGEHLHNLLLKTSGEPVMRERAYVVMAALAAPTPPTTADAEYEADGRAQLRDTVGNVGHTKTIFGAAPTPPTTGEAERDAARADLATAREQLAAIEALHQPETPFPDEPPCCGHCTAAYVLPGLKTTPDVLRGIQASVTWPCPTIRALGAAVPDSKGDTS